MKNRSYKTYSSCKGIYLLFWPFSFFDLNTATTYWAFATCTAMCKAWKGLKGTQVVPNSSRSELDSELDTKIGTRRNSGNNHMWRKCVYRGIWFISKFKNYIDFFKAKTAARDYRNSGFKPKQTIHNHTFHAYRVWESLSQNVDSPLLECQQTPNFL